MFQLEYEHYRFYSRGHKLIIICIIFVGIPLGLDDFQGLSSFTRINLKYKRVSGELVKYLTYDFKIGCLSNFKMLSAMLEK